MDVFGKALLCVALVYVLNEIVKRKLPVVWEKADLFVALAVGIGVVWLVGATVWGRTELIAGVALSDMNAAEHFVAGLLIGAASVGFDLVLGKNSVIRDIGVPIVRRPTAKLGHPTKPVAGTGLVGAKASLLDNDGDNGYAGDYPSASEAARHTAAADLVRDAGIDPLNPTG